MNYNIISESNRRIPRKKISILLDLITEDEDPGASAVNIIFIQNDKIKKLNKLFRGMDRPTDVLSFNIDDIKEEDSVLGEIYISTDMAEDNAQKYNRKITDEILLLCCHGFLHLLGYNHDRDADYEKMHKREKYYLEKMNKC